MTYIFIRHIRFLTIHLVAGSKDRLSPTPPDANHRISFISGGRMAPIPKGESRRPLMKSDLVYITDPIEHTFAEAVMDAGLIIYPGPEVISPIPVKDAHGPGYRTLMHADYEVVRQRRKRSYSAVVELTKSKRSTPGKKTQLRIALAAGLPNYHQLEPQFVQELPHLLQTPKRRTLIDQLGLKKQK